MGFDLSDSFNRAAAGSAPKLGVPDVGFAWADYRGTWTIDTNQAKVDTAHADFSAAAVETYDPEGYVEIVLSAAINNGTGIGIAYRLIDSNNFRFVFLYRSNTSPFPYLLYSGKLEANVGSYDHFSAMDLGSLSFPKTLKMDFYGSTVRAFFDSVQQGSDFTSTLGQSTGTKHGLVGLAVSTARVDSIVTVGVRPRPGVVVG